MSWQNDPITPPAPSSAPAAPWANDPIVGPTPRQVLSTAVTIKPDAMAEAERLAKRYPAPAEVIVQDLEAYRLQEVLDLSDSDLQKAPMLRELMRRDVKLATMAQDDIPTLTKVGNFVSDLGGAAKAGVFRASRGAAGTFQAGFELLAPALDFLEPVTVVGGNPLRRLAEGFAMQGQAAGQTASVARPKTDGVLESGFFSGIESLTQNLLTLPMAFAPGGQGAALAGMTSFTGGDAYQQAREKGLPMSQALPFAASQAAIEYATEKLPLANLLKDVKAGAGFLRILGRQIALEVPGEQIATVLQDLNEWAILNPEKPFSSYLEERPSAAAQTLVATIVGTGGNVAVTKGIEAMVSRAVRDGANMQQAGLVGQALQQAMAGAEASLLRQRSPEQFRSLMSEMSQDGSLYIDAEVLNQMPPELLQQMPGVVEALPEALAANSSVEVKLADALTVLPGTPQAEVFMQNARSAPDAPSLAEAEEAGKTAQQFLQQEAERVIAQAQDQEAMRASSEAVRQSILSELNTAGRYRGKVNEGMASWASAFYTAYSSRLGITPEEMYQRYRLRVLGQATGQGEVLNAGESVGIAQGDVGDDGRPNNIAAYISGAEARAFINADANADGSYSITESGLPDDMRGKGLGVQLYERLIQEIASRGERVTSGTSVSADAQRVYAALARRGYTVTQNPDAMTDPETGALEAAGPVYEITPPQQVFEQRGAQPARRERPIPPEIAAAADVGNARTIAASQQWPTNRDFKLAIQNAVRAVMGKRDLRADTPENRAYITQQLLKEAREALVTNSNAIGWYDEKVTTALEVVSTIHPELKTDEQAKFAFIWALAVTSNGVKVDKNFELAERSYRHWKDSNADPAKRTLPTSGVGVGPTASKIHAGLATYNTLMQRWGFDRLKAFATTLQQNRQVKATFGRPVSGEGVDTMVYGAGVLGPKIGNGFFMNLYGEFGQLTMDRWWVRMWGRLTGDLVEIDPKKTRESRNAFVAIIDMVKADKAATRAVEQAIGTRLGKGNPVEMAKAIIKASAKEEVRDALAGVMPASPELEAAVIAARGKVKDFVSVGDELRKAAKSYYGYLDGQIEVPGGSKRRDMMREVSQAVLAELQKDNPSLTMADFQALMWYPEKTLYDSAGAQEQDSEGYDDDEAPDYANAAIKLARDQGVSDANINAAVERARSDIASRQRARRIGRATGGVPASPADGAGTDTGAAGPDTGVLNQNASAPLSEFQFFRQYAQHIDIRGARDGSAEANRESILKNGFKKGVNVNALPPSRGGPPTNIVEKAYAPKAGNIVYLAPKDAWKVRRNGIEIQSGWTPKPWEVIAIGEDDVGKSMYDLYVREWRKYNEPTLQQGPRGTFNPRTLELVLSPTADLSTFFHETGHFFLEVLADIASQPGAPAQIVEDMNAFLKWSGVPDLATWNGYSLEQKRPYHERWAESIEQYVMEGKAPNAELQPLMRRFRAWLINVYGSIKQFLAQRGVIAGDGQTLGQAPAPEGVLTDEDGQPLVLYHGTDKDISKFKPRGRAQAIFLSPSPDAAASFADLAATKTRMQEGQDEDFGQNVLPVFVKINRPFDFSNQEQVADLADSLTNAYGAIELQDGSELDPDDFAEQVQSGAWRVIEDPAVIAYIKDNFDGFYVVENGIKNLAVFNPKQIVSATSGDVLGQGDQPAGADMQLNDDIRRVMDRMLATDEQIQQANEVAGLVPDEQADGEAAERLQKRSMADLKWAVKARDKVIAKLKREAREVEKTTREAVTAEVDATPEMQAKRKLDELRKSTPEYKAALKAWQEQRQAARDAAAQATRDNLLATEGQGLTGLKKGQFLAGKKREIENQAEAAALQWERDNPKPERALAGSDADVAAVADSFGYETVDAMLQAIDAFGSRTEAIDALTERRMLEENGDLIDERAIQEAANEAVHNEARARSLATELRTQQEMLGQRTDTGQVNARGARITVNALVEAAKQFGANVVARTALRDLKATAWKHTAAERRAGKRWQEHTAKGETADAVKAKQDQVLNNAAAKAALDAANESKKILEFFRRVVKGNDEKVVEKGRDPDIVNAARAVLAAYGIETPTTKAAAAYLEALQQNDPETAAVVGPMILQATQNAQPLEALTFEELQGLHESIQAMWFLAKRTRQMEVDGDLMDIDDAAGELYTRMEEIGIPDTVPGESGALTKAELIKRAVLQQAPALLRRVEQWAEAKDGKFGGPFLRLIFQPIKDAADRYRAERLEYRKKFQILVDNIAPMMPTQPIEAPELNYTFGRGHNGIGMAELLHAILHTGNESNKRKLLLGRGWATELPDGTLDTSRWDAFIQRLANSGVLQREHFDFAQGVWDLLEQTKPLAQKTHRDVFGRYFAEVTADSFTDPFGVARRGGYVPAQADPLLVQDAELRDLLETENAGMSYAFPSTNRGFTKSRVEYNRPLKLDLRSLPQHIDKVLLFSHMEAPVRSAARLIKRPKVSQPLGRIDPAAISGVLKPWLNRSARQTVETPISADAGLNRMLSSIRARTGMALMFANLSNTLQQITGVSSAAIKVKPSLMMRSLADYVANPKKFTQAVWGASPYMADRASNEVAVLSDTLEKILINPSVYESAENFTRRHAYFLQTAFDNVLSPIIWQAAYNQGLTEGMEERMAIRYADGVIRQTQGSTLPEDVSRIETGPAYARVFTQFVGYFNMLANTNATALQQIAQEQGLKKGAGKAFGVLMLGLMIPIWVAEAIALAFKGGPDDEDDDGYLDDWLAQVFGFGTIKGVLSGIPFVGALGQSVVNRFNDQPADDKFSLSPTVSVLESAAGAPASVYKAIVDDASAQKAVRDVAALITVTTGMPAMTLARPVGYGAGVAQGKIEPTGPVDAARGLVTGTASPESKQR